MCVQDGEVACRVSLRAPLLAFVNGERMAIVMTTSSGLFFWSASTPEGEYKWEEICLRRCMVV